MKLLWLAAHPTELAPLAAQPATFVVGTIGVRVATVGVGLAAAAAGTARALQEERPSAVVLTGSCGLYPQRGVSLSIGDEALPERVGLHEVAHLRGRVAYPAAMPTWLWCHAGIAHGLLRVAKDAHLCSAATTLGISTDDDLASELGQGMHDVENLEAFGVAQACRLAGVPFAALLGVTNTVGAGGRAQWQTNAEMAAERTVARVLGWLNQDAPGLPRRASEQP